MIVNDPPTHTHTHTLYAYYNVKIYIRTDPGVRRKEKCAELLLTNTVLLSSSRPSLLGNQHVYYATCVPRVTEEQQTKNKTRTNDEIKSRYARKREHRSTLTL